MSGICYSNDEIQDLEREKTEMEKQLDKEKL